MRQIPLSLPNACPHQKVQGIRLVLGEPRALLVVGSVCNGKNVCCSNKFGNRCLVEQIVTLDEARALREISAHER